MISNTLINKHSKVSQPWQIVLLLASSNLLFGCSSNQQNRNPADVVTLMSDSSLSSRAQANRRQYRVESGDTLWQIARKHSCSVADLVKYNQLQPPYSLCPGQLIALSGIPKAIQPSRPTKKLTAPPVHTKTPKTTLAIVQASDNLSKQPAVSFATPPIPASNATATQWLWPTQGKIIAPFSSIDGGNRGIDIAGTLGQAIYSSAAGRVVYAGNALPGYGHLLIIKHTGDWLTAYAHNDKLLVREQQLIKSGQKIATMGRSDTRSVKLHFQIRYQGKSVNPLRYLPKR
ncbi:MAG: peptidoglycan DD-metalloendopeptidase family protein [Candidatus Symbiodolus clandestinus]